MEQKLKERIPDKNCSVHQYALQTGKESVTFNSTYQKNSVIGYQRNSTSVLKTFARTSIPEKESVPEDIDKKYVRQFTKN